MTLKGSVQQDDEEDENNPVLCLPYVQGLSEKIEKQTKDINIRTVFTAKHTLRSCLMKVKTPRNSLDHKGVVYSIPCETGRTLTERMSEHKRAVKNGDSNNALAASTCQTIRPQHPMGRSQHTDKGRTLDKEEDQGRDSH